MKITPFDILLMEDNEGDILLTMEALEDGKIFNTLKVTQDGASMLHYLKEIAEKFPSDLPDLNLLDINLPKKNRHEVLKEVKSIKLLKHIFVIMLTISSSAVDILKSSQKHFNCYLIKPMEVRNFLKVIEKIEYLWLSIVSLPKMT
jgi:chemotaxis family two-component system response regulator Rcp1